MAAPTEEPLQVLNHMITEVLVQTGKQLKAAAKDGPKDIATEAYQAKVMESMATYHYAVDDIESEITRAKAVLLRDLENLRASRAPAPVAVAVPAPTPTPAPQPVAPPAPMMEMPSSAAHTMNAPAFTPKQESKSMAPFPDMGMGMSDVVDLTAGDKKPSPRPSPQVPHTVIKPPARATPPVKNEVKPSPKPTPKPTPKSTPKATPPLKVTPVPPPQIPRLQPPPPKPQAQAQPILPPQPPQPAPQPAQKATAPVPAAQPAQGSALDTTLSLPPTGTGGENAVPGNGNDSTFTDMQFSLAPPNNDAQGAPPAPMPEFDLAAFAPSGGNNNVAMQRTSANHNTNTNSNTAGQGPKDAENTGSNLDDPFNFGEAGGGNDGMFDLGGGSSVNDSTFDDMMYFGNNDSDMAQFDDAYFGL
ncbi:Uu.00g004880.m01.CDS01 [Anthostomella pinea]|uniref:Uu.00g004880.m01.CDS01 n=1 Tax=Anthostomella pinea TaxID=933095 RepID=A0AAI8VK46_9PEZI|nr:Uu.00g004880.m01.CDS01 [Anthostomella pinea]